jgi:hypothetical protein
MNFIRLTAPNDLPIYFSTAQIVGFGAFSGHTEVYMADGDTYNVKETPAEIAEILALAGILTFTAKGVEPPLASND